MGDYQVKAPTQIAPFAHQNIHSYTPKKGTWGHIFFIKGITNKKRTGDLVEVLQFIKTLNTFLSNLW